MKIIICKEISADVDVLWEHTMILDICEDGCEDEIIEEYKKNEDKDTSYIYIVEDFEPPVHVSARIIK